MNRQEYINRIFHLAVAAGLCTEKREFADLLEVNRSGLSSAMNGSERHLTDSLIKKVRQWATQNGIEETMPSSTENETVLLLPWEAKGGQIGDFVDSIQQYQCERIVSPIKGADYAMQVVGDSMSPEYPSGSVILIKKINEEIFVEWGKVYVLDTPNGAVIKQVRKTTSPDVIECISINPAYQPFLLECKYITGWYKVLMVMAAK